MLLRITRLLSLLGAILLALVTGPADAQQPARGQAVAALSQLTTPRLSAIAARNPPTSVGGKLRSLAARSGVVFLGSVQSIDRQAGVVTVTFEVLKPVVGNPGATYTLREWAGLWTMGRERFAVGQRALFFLHPPGPSGLSSPVDGMDGVVPFLPSSADAESLLDVRWLATRVQREVGVSLAKTHTGAVSLTETAVYVAHWNSSEPLAEPTQRALPSGLRRIAVAASGVAQ
jgi:hypothetical protein